MPRRLKHLLALCCLALSLPVMGNDLEAGLPERVVAPYFFISGRDDATELLPLKASKASVRISGVIAHVELEQTYANLGDVPVHARYIFPGSTRAAVIGMRMQTGERIIRAQIQEKARARQTYEQAKSEGKNASLLEQERPNVFSTEVANIMPGDSIRITLTYTELLQPEDGVYEFVFPAVVGPRYGGRDAAGDPGQQWIANPYLRSGRDNPVSFELNVDINAPVPLQDLVSTSHDITTTWHDEQAAALTLAGPDSDPGNRDFILRYRLQGNDILSGLQRHEGDTENYFLLMAQPPERVRPEQIPAREYIFVIDVSGSMSGFPLDVSKRMMRSLIDRLSPRDRFNMLFFAGGSTLFSPQSLPATRDNLDRAFTMLDEHRGGGGTELLSAMQRALALPESEGSARSIVILTDGYIAAERPVFQHIRSTLGDSNIFAFGIGSSVNRYLVEGIARAGNGEMFVVTDPAEAEAVSDRFVDYIEAPVLTDIAVAAEDVTLYDMEPAAIGDLLGQRPVLVFGKYRNAGPDASIRLTGTGGNGAYSAEYAFTDADTTDNAPLPWLWARKRISNLSDFQFADPDENREAIVELGLQYSLLTQFTSFVAVDERIRNAAGGAEDVTQPLPLPQGVSELAVGGRRHVSEPALPLLLLSLLAGLAFKRRRSA